MSLEIRDVLWDFFCHLLSVVLELMHCGIEKQLPVGYKLAFFHYEEQLICSVAVKNCKYLNAVYSIRHFRQTLKEVYGFSFIVCYEWYIKMFSPPGSFGIAHWGGRHHGT